MGKYRWRGARVDYRFGYRVNKSGIELTMRVEGRKSTLEIRSRKCEK